MPGQISQTNSDSRNRLHNICLWAHTGPRQIMSLPYNFLINFNASKINAPVGYQEVVGQAYEWLLLIDPTCTDLITQPELRRILINQQWGLVCVSVTSLFPTGALISDNQGCDSPCRITKIPVCFSLKACQNVQASWQAPIQSKFISVCRITTVSVLFTIKYNSCAPWAETQDGCNQVANVKEITQCARRVNLKYLWCIQSYFFLCKKNFSVAFTAFI